MAPVGMVGVLGDLRSVVWSSSPEVGVISVFVFLILSISLMTLCLKCRRNSGNAYDVNAAETEGQGGVNGTTGTANGNLPNDPGTTTYTEWRGHQNMPTNTLERTGVSAN